MARIPGSFEIGSNYEVGIAKPFDARQLVGKVADLTNEATWKQLLSGASNAFKGMMVACAEDACIYVLKDKSNITNLELGWAKIGPADNNTNDASFAIFANSEAELPNIGEENILYIVEASRNSEHNKCYRWKSDELKYIRLSSDWQDIEVINGGYANFIKERFTSDYIPE